MSDGAACAFASDCVVEKHTSWHVLLISQLGVSVPPVRNPKPKTENLSQQLMIANRVFLEVLDFSRTQMNGSRQKRLRPAATHFTLWGRSCILLRSAALYCNLLCSLYSNMLCSISFYLILFCHIPRYNWCTLRTMRKKEWWQTRQTDRKTHRPPPPYTHTRRDRQTNRPTPTHTDTHTYSHHRPSLSSLWLSEHSVF